MRTAFAFVVALCIAVPAFAQSAPPQGQPPAPAQAAPAPGATPSPGQPVAQGKSAQCRDQARQQRLRGEARQDFIQVCRLEGRLACLKEAIAKKIVGPARRDYLKSCDS